MTAGSWCSLIVSFDPADRPVAPFAVDDFADLLVTLATHTPGLAMRRWCIHKAGRGDAHGGLGCPTLSDLAVPELEHGAMLSADDGFLSLLSHARTRRIDKNWGRVYPDKRVGHDVQLTLRGLTDDQVVEVTRWCRSRTPDLQARGATTASLQWRAGGQNHLVDLLATSD